VAVLAHRLDGSGEPLLLLNGGMMSYGVWEPIAAPLSRSHRVLRCDLRGQLLSPGEPPASLEGHVEEVLRLLDALGLERAHVLGTSFGGEVGLLLAARAPERVRSLMVVAVVDRFDASGVAESVRLMAACEEALAGGDRGAPYDVIRETAFSAPWAREHEGELRERRAQVAGLPDAWFRGVQGIVGLLPQIDLGPVLPLVSCPTLVVRPGNDAAMPRERTEAVAAAVPGARLAVIEGAGHAAILEAWEEVLALARGFFPAPAAGAEGGS
jgi:pimeloyl-ACP methyl ester carboxylesterase